MSQNQSNTPEFNQFIYIHDNDNEIQNIQPHILLNSSEFLQNEIKNYITHLILDIKKQYNIKKESIKIFYDILNSHLLPDNITSDQYLELIKLMHIFKIKSIPKLNNVNIAIDLLIAQLSLNDIFLSNDILSVGIEDFLTQNIDKCFENEKFGQLNIATIHRIISKCNNKRDLNDKLIKFITNLIDERFSLFSLIEIENLSDEIFNGLFDFYQNNPDKQIYFEHLSKYFTYIKELRDKSNQLEDLKQQNDKLKNKLKKMPYSIIQYNDSENNNESKENQFKGILYHLKKNNEKDYMDKKIVKVMASSVRNNESKESPFYVIDFIKNNRFVSENEKDQFVCLDFIDIKVKPNKYSIMSSTGSIPKSENPQSWLIEGSNDKKNWDELDEKNGEESIDGKGLSNIFDIKESKKFYRYLRIRQTGESTTAESYTLKIGQIEFFGEINLCIDS